MKKTLLLLAALFVQASAWAATYTYAGPPYNASELHNFSDCQPGMGNCGAYTTAMAETGSFTTAVPVAANLTDQDITAQVTSFTFSDGLTTYASGDPHVRMNVKATTTGGVLQFFVTLLRWQTPAPHANGDHLDRMSMNQGGQHNAVCSNVEDPQGDRCLTSSAAGVFSSWRDDLLADGTWTVTGLPPAAPTAVPTLGEWGLVLLAGLLAALGLRQRRKA
jgi:hypothetical protein